MKVASFPYITPAEFEAACEHFVAACQVATFVTSHNGGLRVSLRREILQTGPEGDVPGEHFFLAFQRSLHVDDADSERLDHDTAVEFDDANHGNAEDDGDEDDDTECLRKTIPGDMVKAHRHRIDIEYHVLLSSTYRVPILYLRLSSATLSLRSSIETAYKYLVPEGLKAPIRHQGIVGGLSMTSHPMFAVPFYFIHPCKTADALKEIAGELQVDVKAYLALWIGLVGPSVGLMLPAEWGLAIHQQQQQQQ